MAKSYTISDGKLILKLTEAEEGGFIVTSLMHPGITTQADTVREAFMMMRDAVKTLRDGTAKLERDLRSGKINGKRSSLV